MSGLDTIELQRAKAINCLVAERDELRTHNQQHHRNVVEAYRRRDAAQKGCARLSAALAIARAWIIEDATRRGILPEVEAQILSRLGPEKT
jgi:hypothetical protein